MLYTALVRVSGGDDLSWDEYDVPADSEEEVRLLLSLDTPVRRDCEDLYGEGFEVGAVGPCPVGTYQVFSQ